MLLESLLGSVALPAIIDLIKGAGGAVGRKFFGISVDDQIKLGQHEVDKMGALAALDNPHGTPSQWVVDLRASFRYIAAPVVILIGGLALYAGIQADNAEVIDMGASLVAMPFGFIFGERMYLGFKGSMAK